MWHLVLSAGVSLLIIGLMIKTVAAGLSGEERAGLLKAIGSVSIAGIAVYAAASLLQAFIRAARFRLLIRAAGEKAPGRVHTMLVTLVRNMTVDMLPSRLGELSYVALMNRGCRVSGQACVSSLSISFLFDLVALVFILTAALVPGIVDGAGSGRGLVGILAAVFVITAIIAVLIFAGLGFCCSLARRLFGAAPRIRIIAAAVHFMERLNEAIARTREERITLRLLGLSLGVRLAKYAGLYSLFLAVTTSAFPGLAAEPVWNVLYALVGAEAAGSLPIPAFMSFGTYEAGGTLAFTILGYPAAVSMVAVGAVHVFSQLVDYSLGGLGFIVFTFMTKPSGGTVPAAVEPGRKRFAAASALVLLLLGLAFAGWQYRKTKKLGSLEPPDAGEQVAVSADDAVVAERVIGRAEGFVVWSSNRNGNHDIYMMELPSRSIRQLTIHPNAEYFPRISPDGKKIVFSRCHMEWASQRNPRPWSVVIIDIASGVERELSRQGNTPVWTEDGQSVVFQRDASSVVKLDVESGREEVLFSPEADRYSSGMEMQTPSYSESLGKLAVTLRGAERGVAVWDRNGGRRGYADGCQIAWAPDGSYLYCVDKGGRQQNAIYKIEPASGERVKWIDLTGEYSHEYFPKVSNTGDYLVLGASTGGHEHDSADYEIFLWKIGDAPEEVMRLTYHTGNDCWPDIYLR